MKKCFWALLNKNSFSAPNSSSLDYIPWLKWSLVLCEHQYSVRYWATTSSEIPGRTLKNELKLNLWIYRKVIPENEEGKYIPLVPTPPIKTKGLSLLLLPPPHPCPRWPGLSVPATPPLATSRQPPHTPKITLQTQFSIIPWPYSLSRLSW